MVEVSLTVGKLDASLALLLTKDHHLIEFPTILLPNGVKAGSIVKIKCERDLDTELEEQRQFQEIQDEIINTFGKNLPKPPLLKIKNVTQTSCVLEWDQLDLGTASLKNLVLFKDGKKLGAIPQPLTNQTTKLSGLPIDKTFKFQLRLDTTAGIYLSETIDVATHKMTDLSGITVCLGDITPNDQFTVEDIQETLKNMGAHYPAQDKVKVDTTHYITTRENKQNPEFVKANDINIPVIRPEWLKACERERRIVGVRDFYVKDCTVPEIHAKNYWQKQTGPPPPEKDIQPHIEAKEPVAPTVNVISPSPEQQTEIPEEPSIAEKLEEASSEAPTAEELEDPEDAPVSEVKETAPIAAPVESVEISEPISESAEPVFESVEPVEEAAIQEKEIDTPEADLGAGLGEPVEQDIGVLAEPAPASVPEILASSQEPSDDVAEVSVAREASPSDTFKEVNLSANSDPIENGEAEADHKVEADKETEDVEEGEDAEEPEEPTDTTSTGGSKKKKNKKNKKKK